MKRSSTIFDVFGKLRWVIMLGLIAMMLVVGVGTAFAQDGTPPDVQVVADSAGDTALSLNVLWVLMAAALVFFMQAGFALVETGFTRNKNVVHTMMMNMMVFCIGALGYWLVGFAFQFGGVNYTYPAINGNPAWTFSPVTLGNWARTAEPAADCGQFGRAGSSGFHAGRVERQRRRAGLLPVPDGLHGYRRDHPHRFDGRALEVQRASC